MAFITCFVTLFAMVIAITKDLPDVKGDKEYNIKTFATELGVPRITLLARRAARSARNRAPRRALLIAQRRLRRGRLGRSGSPWN